MQTLRRLVAQAGLALLASLVVGCAASPPVADADVAKLDRLLGLVVERLSMAIEVARVKWNTGAPIEDPPREKHVIDEVVKRADEFGLAPAVVEAFFSGQIEASKRIQHALHAEWRARAQPPFARVADLRKDIRPVLDRLSPEMLRALAGVLPVLRTPGGLRLLDARARSLRLQAPDADAAIREALAPLRALSR